MLPSYSCWTFFRPAACAASLDVCVFTTFLIFEAHSAPLSENKKDSLVCFFMMKKCQGWIWTAATLQLQESDVTALQK